MLGVFIIVVQFPIIQHAAWICRPAAGDPPRTLWTCFAFLRAEERDDKASPDWTVSELDCER